MRVFFLLIYFSCLIMGCSNGNKGYTKNDQADVLTVKVEKMVIDHVVKNREGCMQTRVRLDILIQNGSKKNLVFCKGQKQYLCFWNDLKPVFTLKSKSIPSDSLLIGFEKEVLIKANSEKRVRCIILNKRYITSIKDISQDLGFWFRSVYELHSLVPELSGYEINVIENKEYKELYYLDNIIVNDSISMNIQVISPEEFKETIDDITRKRSSPLKKHS